MKDAQSYEVESSLAWGNLWSWYVDS